MWEKFRQNGTKKLKTCAVPTIFPVHEKRLSETAAEFLDSETVDAESLDRLKAKKLRSNENCNENINKEPTSIIVTNHSQAVTNIDEEHPVTENNSTAK